MRAFPFNFVEFFQNVGQHGDQTLFPQFRVAVEEHVGWCRRHRGRKAGWRRLSGRRRCVLPSLNQRLLEGVVEVVSHGDAPRPVGVGNAITVDMACADLRGFHGASGQVLGSLVKQRRRMDGFVA